jgi:hypothetical protein
MLFYARFSLTKNQTAYTVEGKQAGPAGRSLIQCATDRYKGLTDRNMKHAATVIFTDMFWTMKQQISQELTC